MYEIKLPDPMHLSDIRRGVADERARVLRAIELTIDDWCYEGEVSENVLSVLVNLGNEVADDDGGAWAERMNDEIERKLEVSREGAKPDPSKFRAYT